MTNPSTSIRRLSAIISQLHVLKTLLERHSIQLQEYTSNNMNTDSFLLHDEDILGLIEEFNGCDQRMFSENVFDMLDCELNVLETIEESYDYLVQYTKVLCSKSEDFGFSEEDCKEFMKSHLVREQQKFMQKMRAEEKRLKGKKRKLFSVFSDNSDSQGDKQDHGEHAPVPVVKSGQPAVHLPSARGASPSACSSSSSSSGSKSSVHNQKRAISSLSRTRIPKKIEPHLLNTHDSSEFVVSSSPPVDLPMGKKKTTNSTLTLLPSAAEKEKENLPKFSHSNPPQSSSTKAAHSYLSASSLQETPPLQEKPSWDQYYSGQASNSFCTPPDCCSRPIPKPRTPIQKVLTPNTHDIRNSHLQHLNLHFRRFLVQQAFNTVSKLNDLAPHLKSIDRNFKRSMRILENHVLKVEYQMDRHQSMSKQLENSVGSSSSSSSVSSTSAENPSKIRNRNQMTVSFFDRVPFTAEYYGPR